MRCILEVDGGGQPTERGTAHSGRVCHTPRPFLLPLFSRGKLRKAREGKVIASHTPNYGFKYNATRDGYEVDEQAMRVVRSTFRMIGQERLTFYKTKRVLERAGIPTASGSRFWHEKAIREDVYKPHTHAESLASVDAGQMASPVAMLLDLGERYGIWWFNRRRTKTTKVAKAGNGRGAARAGGHASGGREGAANPKRPARRP